MEERGDEIDILIFARRGPWGRRLVGDIKKKHQAGAAISTVEL